MYQNYSEHQHVSGMEILSVSSDCQCEWKGVEESGGWKWEMNFVYGFNLQFKTIKSNQLSRSSWIFSGLWLWNV